MNLFLLGFLVGGAVTLCLDWAIREYQIRRDHKLENLLDSYRVPRLMVEQGQTSLNEMRDYVQRDVEEPQNYLDELRDYVPTNIEEPGIVRKTDRPKMGITLSEQEQHIKNLSKKMNERDPLPDGFIRVSPEMVKRVMEPQIHPIITLPDHGITYTKIQKPGRHRKG